MKQIFLSIALTLLVSSFASAQNHDTTPKVVIALDVSTSMSSAPSARLTQVWQLARAYETLAHTPCILPHQLVVGFWASTPATVLNAHVDPRHGDDVLERIVPAILELQTDGNIPINPVGTYHLLMEGWVSEQMNSNSIAIISTDESQDTYAKRNFRWYGLALPSTYQVDFAQTEGGVGYLKRVAGDYRKFHRTLEGASDYIVDIITNNLGGACMIG